MKQALVAFAIIGSLGVAVDHADAAPATLPACTVEDASSGPLPCVWLASEAGNGEGHSFRAFRNGHFKMITDRAARRLLGI